MAVTSPRPRFFRQIVVPLALAVLGCAGVVAGFILLLVQLHAPINPISGPDGYVSQVACGNSLSAAGRWSASASSSCSAPV